MLAVVLGAAAGGGFPQWNSNAPSCRRARSSDSAAMPRTQASIAVSHDGEAWFLFNAAPDLRQQIEATPVLQPKHGLRSSPIAGVVLSGADVDVIAGLLTMRERQPFTVYATSKIHQVLRENSIFTVLAADVVTRRVVGLAQKTDLLKTDGMPSGLAIEFVAVPGKVPLYLEPSDHAPELIEGEETVAVEITDGRHRMLFIPGCAKMTGRLAARIDGADLVLFDGTVWVDDEMIRAGLGNKTGRRMGHMSVSGPGSTMEAFESISVGRKILIHVNNSNPILLDDSPERSEVEAAGWEVAYDGMEIRL